MNRRKFLNWAAGVGAFLAWPFQAKAKPESEPKPEPKPEPKSEPKPFSPYDLDAGDYAIVFTGEDSEVYVTGRLRSLQQPVLAKNGVLVAGDSVFNRDYQASIDSCGAREPYAHPLFAAVVEKTTYEHQPALLINRVSQDSWRLHEVTPTGWSICSEGGELTGWSVHFRFKELRPGHAMAFFNESLGTPYTAVEE